MMTKYELLLRHCHKRRVEEYPPITDQLDLIMKWLSTEQEFGIPAELKSMSCKCMSIKSKYPKPEKQHDETTK